ncbi:MULTISPECIES: TraB/VirB10 family protein [Sphingomonadales]|uniref:Conjugal transfer protein TraB n=3 Tax=Sphingomonadaceae TaxID=41297 RepID=A0A0S3F0Y5_9SPHN|nr:MULTISPECIES: TraB/VirB10 family protein [Sphingomonadaceae]ALR21341.1 conjugal transfer protein TraB [Sphingobium baderi]AMG73076.1 Conjugal transfer protein TraB [Sphingopyxis granuli]QUT05334.1 TraB/VirB10 family protein [Sphingobium phenoxybenzoativorans]
MSGGDSRGSRGPRGRGPDDRAEELDLDGYQADRPRPGETPRGPALLDLKTRWQTLTARQQLRLRQLGVAGAIGVLGLGLYTASGDKTEQAAPSPSSKLDMGAGLRGDSLEVKLRGDLQKILDGQQLLGDRVTAIEEGKVVPGSGTPPHALDGDLPPAIPGAVPDFPEPPATGDIDPSVAKPPAPPAAPPAPPAPPVEKTVGAIGAATSPVAAADGAQAAKKKTRTIYLPPGFMKARLLTGIDALASRDATNNPEPLIARVQAPAVLPNDVKANLAGCFVIGNATGSLAKERVEIQLVSLSCVDFDERSVVDQPIKGFFVDADGKKGLSGKVVTRAGAALARAFIAGTITGVADTVQNTIGDVSTSALGSVRTLDAGDAAKAGIAGGLSRSSEKLTDFYLDLARQAGPIVEVGAAKDVVVVIQEGVTLEIKPTAGSKF